MQLVTSRTISPQVITSLLPNDFSKIARSLEQKNHSASLHRFVNFRGQINVGDFLLPVQDFSLKEKDNFVFIENFPTKSFPKIKIVLEKKSSVLDVKNFDVSTLDSSIQGEILYLRLSLLLAEVKKCSLNFKGANLEPFDFSFSKISLQEKKQLLNQVKLFLKLGFIERVFEKTNFNVPENIAPDEVEQIEILFKGMGSIL